MNEESIPDALVIMNPAAGGGRGLKRWEAVKNIVSRSFNTSVIEMNSSGSWKTEVGRAVSGGIRVFIACGGDGTVKAVIDQLVRTTGDVPLESFTLGAVGTGSSNDYHKPVGRSFREIPLRVGPDHKLRDVCRARYFPSDGKNKRIETFFITSASMGLVAEANAFFSGDQKFQKWLRSKWTNGAIIYAALHTLYSWENSRGQISFDGRPDEDLSITNLSITKTQWLSGHLKYDTPVNQSDGLFTVNICEGMTRLTALRTMMDLSRGVFTGGEGRRHCRVKGLKADFPQALTFELDGETFKSAEISFDILNEQIVVFT